MDYQIEELHRINADKNRIIDQLRGSVFQLQRDLDALES